MRPAALLAWGLLVHKAFAALTLLLAHHKTTVVLAALLTGCLADGALVLTAALIGRSVAPRGRPLLLWLCGAIALYAVLNTTVVAAVGAPLTPAMLVYAADARLAAAGTPALVLGALSLLVFVVGVRALLPRVVRWPERRLVVALLALTTLGVLPFLERGEALRTLGLWRSPPLELVRGALASEPAPAARIPWTTTGDVTHQASVVERAPPPRHVVLWLAESIGARHVSLYGAPTDNTPTLEALRPHALVFDDAFAPTPVSAKAIFSVLCGLYPLPEPAFESRVLPRIGCPSFPETLAPHGFVSALFHGGYFAFTDKRALLEERGFDVLLDGENLPGRERWWHNGWGVDDAALVEAALAWFDQQRASGVERTFTFFIPLLPHHEYFLPPDVARPFGEATPDAKHRNGVRYNDRLFGQVVEAFKSRGVFEETLFVYLGDHGEAFDEHPNNRVHGSFLFDENVRIPLVFINPRLFPDARRSPRLAAQPDVLPTVLDLLDLPLPNGLQGRSLVEGAMAPRGVPIATHYPHPLLGLVDGPYKFVREQRSGREQLFDRGRDPRERTNLARLLPDVTASMRARALHFADTQGTLLRAWPQRGAPYLDRVFAAMTATLNDAEGNVACIRDGAVLRCGDGATVQIATERTFNMEQRCLLVELGAQGALTLTTHAAPPPKTVGLGLTDRSRFAKKQPLRARFAVDGVAVADLQVDAVFESTSRLKSVALPSPQAGAGSGGDVEVRIEGATGDRAAACVTLAP